MILVRSYRKPLTPKETADEIERSSGVQFRPEIVKTFLQVINRTA